VAAGLSERRESQPSGAASREVPHTLIRELDKQGTTGLPWNQRRAENLAPDDLVKGMGDAPPQPEVHRVDSANIQVVIEEMRAGGVECVVLDLPGAHNFAVAKAIAASDYILIPSRPNDIDVPASLETVDIARRLKKRFAYVFTFVPSSGLPTQRSVMHWPRRSTPTLTIFPTSSTGGSARRLRRSSVTCLGLSMWRVDRMPSPSRGQSFA
jgi:hypothetical protein